LQWKRRKGSVAGGERRDKENRSLMVVKQKEGLPGGHIPGKQGRRDRHKAACEAKFHRGEVGEGTDPLGRTDR